MTEDFSGSEEAEMWKEFQARELEVQEKVEARTLEEQKNLEARTLEEQKNLEETRDKYPSISTVLMVRIMINSFCASLCSLAEPAQIRTRLVRIYRRTLAVRFFGGFSLGKPFCPEPTGA